MATCQLVSQHLPTSVAAVKTDKLEPARIWMDLGRQGTYGSAVADRRGLLLRWIGYGMPIQHIHLSTPTTAAVSSATSSPTFPASALMHLLQEIQTVDRRDARDSTAGTARLGVMNGPMALNIVERVELMIYVKV